MHIAVAGNIGSGKTTLTGLLAKHYKWEAHYEDVESNPYINDFYDDMHQVMKETKGKGDPKLATDLMRAAIG